jgi:hypothetical protein
MSAGTISQNSAERHSFIQAMNEKWQRKYQDEQAWLDSMDEHTIERTR